MSTEAPTSVVGWRAWEARGDGILRSPVPRGNALGLADLVHRARTGQATGTVWERGRFLAECYKFPGHQAPAIGCNCGIRAVEDLGALARFGLGHEGRTTSWWHDSLHAVGQVELSGRVLPSTEWIDPPGTWRGLHARAVGVLYLARPLAHSALYVQLLHGNAVEVRTIETLALLQDVAPGDPLPEHDKALFLETLPPLPEDEEAAG